MDNHVKIFLYLFIILILSENTFNYIILPFKSTNPKFNLSYDDSSNFVTNFLKELDKNKIYTKISIGDPIKDVVMYLSMVDSYFAIIKDYCTKEVISTYDPYSSKSCLINMEKSITISNLFNTRLANDTIIFYNDTKLEEKMIINFDYYLANKTTTSYDNYLSNSFCGKMGLLKKYSYPSTYTNFIDYLKRMKIIQSYQWGIFFFDKEKSYNIDEKIQKEYDGFFIAGLNENDYMNIFKTNDISNVYQLMIKTKNIGGKFDKIYFMNSEEEVICQKELNFEINVDYNYIICMKDYYENIKKYYFNNYLENNICIERNSPLLYGFKDYMIVCNLTIKNDLKNFPNLYLFYRELNFTFKLDYNDLFIELNDKLYFLAIYTEVSDTIWNFGKLLIKKYSFMFD